MGLISGRMTMDPYHYPAAASIQQQAGAAICAGMLPRPAPAPPWNGAKARREAAFDRGQLAPRPAAGSRARAGITAAETETHVSRLLGACLARPRLVPKSIFVCL